MPSTLKDLITELETGTKLILAHQNADADAIGSAVALYYSFPEITLGIHENVSRIGKKILKELNVEVKALPSSELGELGFDKVVILDASTPTQIGHKLDDVKNLIIIDHHMPTDTWGDNVKIYYCDDTRTSCAEIIYWVLKNKGVKIDNKIGTGLLLGILTDTSHFRRANVDTFRTITAILEESQIDLEHVQSIIKDEEFDTNDAFSLKIANLKSMQRLKYEIVGKNRLVVATSHVSSFEASACKVLLFAGADVAFVGSERRNNVRISARAKSNIVKHGLHLGRFLADVGKECGCEGGGHGGAAGLAGEGDVEAILGICTAKLKEWITANKS